MGDKGSVRLSYEEDVTRMTVGDSGHAWGWALFRARCAHGAYTFESLRFPGLYLCAYDMGGRMDRSHGSLRLMSLCAESRFVLGPVEAADSQT